MSRSPLALEDALRQPELRRWLLARLFAAEIADLDRLIATLPPDAPRHGWARSHRRALERAERRAAAVQADAHHCLGEDVGPRVPPVGHVGRVGGRATKWSGD